MELSAEVVEHAQAIARSYGTAVLSLRVASPTDDGSLVDRIRGAVAGLRDGEVHWEADGGVVHQWGFTPDIRATLLELREALEAAGIDGSLELCPPETPTAPSATLLDRPAELLECHLRVRGQRRHVPGWGHDAAVRRGLEPPPPDVRFLPDEEALLAGLETALAWVAEPPPGAEWRSAAGRYPTFDDVCTAVKAHLLRGRTVPRVWWESEEAFRLIVVEPASANVSVVEGGARLAGGDWRPSYEALLEVLRSSVAWSSYGLIKRGRSPAAAGHSLMYDSVPSFHYGSYNLDHHRYEDVLAPDAFGAQLLGPGYAGRIPAGGDWEQVDVGRDSVLLLHRDPAAWFAEPLPPITTDDALLRNPGYPTPDVIRKAREDLAPILIRFEVDRDSPLDPLGA